MSADEANLLSEIYPEVYSVLSSNWSTPYPKGGILKGGTLIPTYILTKWVTGNRWGEGILVLVIKKKN